MTGADRRDRPAPEWLPAWRAGHGVGRATALFADRFVGARPDGVWSAPGRVNVIGEHTDYNGGLCLPMALPHRTFVALRRRAERRVRLASAQERDAAVVELSLDDVLPGQRYGWAGYAAGVAWALRRAGHDVGGFDAAVDSCVPYGAGLSSSAALECAVAVALDDVLGLGLTADADGRRRLARVCVEAENEIAGAATGGLDQSAALLCQPGHALLLDFRDGSCRQIPLDLAARDFALLVVDTRAAHDLADGQYGDRRAVCEQAARVLGVGTLREVDDLDAALSTLESLPDRGFGAVAARRVRHVVTENARVGQVACLLDGERVEDVGPVLTAGHASLRDDYDVSCRELDLAVETAVGAGALGARMVGGGFGGSAIALLRADELPAIAGVVAAAYAAAALTPPAFLAATPAEPAGRST